MVFIAEFENIEEGTKASVFQIAADKFRMIFEDTDAGETIEIASSHDLGIITARAKRNVGVA